MCWFWETSCLAKEAAQTVGDSLMDQLAHNVSVAMASTIETLGSFWVTVPTIPLGDTQGNPSDPVGFLQGHTWWIWSTLMVFSVLYAAGQMIWSRKGQPLMELVAALIRSLLASSAGLGAVVILLQVGDSYSTWILDKSVEGGFTKGLQNIMSSKSASDLQIFMIVAGIIAMLVSLVQICLLIVRSALSVLLAGTLPLAYSATNTQWGKQWSQKHASWLIAFVLYKPVAATIYAAAFKVTGSALTGQLKEGAAASIVGLMSGLVLMVAALFALPAMMRLIVPAVGAASAGGAMFAGAAVGSAASGAVNMGSRMAAKGGSSGGGGAAGASGAGGAGASGAAAAKGAGTAAAGAATGGAALALMAVGAAAKKGTQAVQAAVHDAAGEQPPQGGSSSHRPAPSQGGGARGGGSGGSAKPKPPQPEQKKPEGGSSGAR